jgi:hypothetical protein
MRTHKILKHWEFHTDSIHSLYVNEGFNKILSGSRNGEVYLTDLTMGCYCNLTKKQGIITSLFMSSSTNILLSTSQGELHEIKMKKNKITYAKKSIEDDYNENKKNKSGKKIPVITASPQKINEKMTQNQNFKRIIPKLFNSSNGQNSEHFSIHVKSKEEVSKYHLMKNKVYLICETKEKAIFYNILKLNRMHELKLNGNLTFDKLIEVISSYDLVNLKSWLHVDIKLGVPTLIFTKENTFSNPYDFDVDYLEKIIENTNSFTRTSNYFSIKFNEKNSFMNASSLTTTQSTSHPKLSSSNLALEKSGSASFKNTMKNTLSESCGEIVLKNIFSNWINQKSKIYKPFFEESFWDTRDWIKNNLLNFDTFKNSKDINNSNFINKTNSNTFFVFSTSDGEVTLSCYNDEIPLDYKLPIFIKDYIKPVNKLNS